MGLYNMIFGESGSSDLLLEILGLTRGDFYRYRDCYLDKTGCIAVYTRGGGGNRDCYCERMPEGQHEDGCAVPMQEKLREHPLYLEDADDEFDCTYCTFYFGVPENVRERVAKMEPEPTRQEIWQAFVAALEDRKQPKNEPE